MKILNIWQIHEYNDLGLYPKITEPSRITPHCATLIDNIFTNDIENNTLRGLLINDISDHLPFFTVYDNNYKRKQLGVKQGYRRVRTEKTINAFKSDLLVYMHIYSQSHYYVILCIYLFKGWGVVYKENDVDNAYNTF